MPTGRPVRRLRMHQSQPSCRGARNIMLDLIYIGATLGFFVIAGLFGRALEGIGAEDGSNAHSSGWRKLP